MNLTELWTAVTAVISVLVGVGYSIGETYFGWARVCFVSAALIFGAMTLFWLFKTTKPLRWRAIGGASATIIFILGLVGSLSWVTLQEEAARAQGEPSITYGDVNNNQGIVTQGQTGGTNTIIQGDPSRTLSESNKQELLARIQRDRPVDIISQSGDAEAAQFAAEIGKFLKNEGYTVGISASLILSKGGRGLNVNLNPQNPTVRITVGSK